MTLSEIVDLVRGQLGSRYQLSTDEALRYIGIAQRSAFDSDINAFLYWDYELAVTLDINGDPEKGPYNWPSDPAHPDCRRLLGVTPFADTMLVRYPPTTWNNTSGKALYSDPSSNSDYGMRTSVDASIVQFQRIRNNPVLRTFSFIDTPSVDDTLRVVYYIRPKALRNVNDDSRVLVPEEWKHHVLVLGAAILADSSVWGDKAPAQRLQEHLFPFWEAMKGSEDDGNQSGSYSEGQPL